MADDFPIDTAQLVALFMESLFYGAPNLVFYLKKRMFCNEYISWLLPPGLSKNDATIPDALLVPDLNLNRTMPARARAHPGLYLVSFGMCMYALLLSGTSGRQQRLVLLTVALLLFTFATLDVAFLLRHVLDAFVWYKGPGGPIGELSIISYWVNVMKTVCYVAQTSVADAMLVRTYWLCRFYSSLLGLPFPYHPSITWSATMKSVGKLTLSSTCRSIVVSSSTAVAGS